MIEFLIEQLAHQFTEDQVRAVVRGLDQAAVPVIEVSHGDGLGGSSFNYGFSGTDEMRLLRAAVEEAEQAKIAILLLPGIGIKDDLVRAHDAGASVARIATHCTEADISEQHLALARDLGMETVGFLMMAHMTSPDALLEQAKLMESYGADCVYVVDSAGAMTIDDARRRVALLKANLACQVGIHAHNNLSLAVANSICAIRAGAVQIDGSTRGFGAGAGNAPVEALVAVCTKLGIETGIDPMQIMDAAEDVVRPVMPEECVVDRLSLTMGFAGVYSSFLKHAFTQAERFAVSPVDILTRAGERKLVGGQEDQLIDIARELQRDAPNE